MPAMYFLSRNAGAVRHKDRKLAVRFDIRSDNWESHGQCLSDAEIVALPLGKIHVKIGSGEQLAKTFVRDVGEHGESVFAHQRHVVLSRLACQREDNAALGIRVSEPEFLAHTHIGVKFPCTVVRAQ